MSCHDIGHGMNYVAKLIREMYDTEEISKETAVKIFRRLQKGVHWCDGNEYEAIECISNRCGICLKELNRGEILYPPHFDVKGEYPEAATDYLCEECMLKLYGEEGKEETIRVYGEDRCKAE
ncbi:MAG: hypothetical protein K2M46_12945 [Lachnospiraceae bacterium]|nr:hypothetical protein [Lachnospiraceae bacterium]